MGSHRAKKPRVPSNRNPTRRPVQTTNSTYRSYFSRSARDLLTHRRREQECAKPVRKPAVPGPCIVTGKIRRRQKARADAGGGTPAETHRIDKLRPVGIRADSVADGRRSLTPVGNPLGRPTRSAGQCEPMVEIQPGKSHEHSQCPIIAPFFEEESTRHDRCLPGRLHDTARAQRDPHPVSKFRASRQSPPGFRRQGRPPHRIDRRSKGCGSHVLPGRRASKGQRRSSTTSR